MKRVILSCSALIGILGSILVAQKALPKGGRLEQLANEARASNKDHIDVPVHFEGVMATLDGAHQYYSVMIIQPTGEETVSADDKAYTWYRSRVIEILSRPTRKALPLASSLDQLSPELKPIHLLPLPPSEILIIKRGGTVAVGGVQINFVNDGFPDFSMHDKTYLVFATLSADGKTAIIPLGANGICELSSNTVRPLGPDDSPIAQELNNLSLRSFRDRLSLGRR